MMKTQRTQVLTLMRKRGTELGLVWIDLSTLHPQLHQFWRSPHQNQNEKTELSVLWDSSSTDTKASSTKCHRQSGQTATEGDLTAKESGGQGPQSHTEHGESPELTEGSPVQLWHWFSSSGHGLGSSSREQHLLKAERNFEVENGFAACSDRLGFSNLNTLAEVRQLLSPATGEVKSICTLVFCSWTTSLLEHLGYCVRNILGLMRAYEGPWTLDVKCVIAD